MNQENDKESDERVSDAEGPSTKVKMVPPDGGWGWVIVASNFLLGMLVHSVSMAFGVVYLALLHQGNSNTAASLIPALLTGISSILGPFSTSLSLYYSHRKLAFIGVALLGSGIGLSAISLKLPWLYFTYGVIGGIGYSLVTPQIFMIGQQYFHKRRVTSHALGSLGNTAGFMIMPLFIFILIQNYSLQGAFLIWSAVIFNGLVAAMLYQPVKWHLKKDILVEDSEKEPLEITKSSEGMNSEIDNDNEHHFTREERDKENNFLEQSKNIDGEKDHIEVNSKNEDDENVDDENEEDENEDVFFDTTFHGRPSSFMSARSYDSFKTTKSYYRSSDTIMVSCINLHDTYGSVLSIKNRLEDDNKAKNGILSPTVQSDPELQDKSVKSNNPYILFGLKIPRITEILSLKLMGNPIFIIYVCSSICNRQLYYSLQTYLPLVAQQVMPRNEVPFIFTIVAITEVVSKVIISLISDRGWIARRYFFIAGGIINFSSVIGLAAANDFATVSTAAAIYGLGIGICSSVGPILLVEHLSMSLLPYTYGLSLFIGGIFNIIMYAIQGWTIDATGSTNVLLIIIASMALIPSILWTLASIFILRKEQDTECNSSP